MNSGRGEGLTDEYGSERGGSVKEEELRGSKRYGRHAKERMKRGNLKNVERMEDLT